MTEYDYSPEAYERYIAKQHSIASWVDKTNQFTPANPFVPTTPAVQARSLQRDSTKSSGHSHQSHHSRSKSARHDREYDRRDRDRDRDRGRDRDRDRHYYSDRAHPNRSNTSPSYQQLPYSYPGATSPTSPSHTQPRPSHSRRSSNSGHSSTRSPTSRHHTSASVSHLPSPTRPAASRSQTSFGMPSQQPRQKTPVRSNTAPAYHPANQNPPYVPPSAQVGKQPVVVPIGGGQYMVVPPKGSRVEVLNQQQQPNYGSQYPSPTYIPQSAAPITYASSPVTPSKQQPLLKRLFTGLTRGGSKQSSGSGMFGKGRRGRRNSY